MKITFTEHYTCPYLYLPNAINWTIKMRNSISSTENDLLSGINSSIIYSLTSLIESFNKQIMLFWIENYIKEIEGEVDFLLERLTDELKKEIELSEWNKQKQLFVKITNNDISNDFPESVINGINELFKIRNLLTHGNKLSLIETEIKYKKSLRLDSDKFNSIYNYLNRNKLIKNLEQLKYNLLDSILSNEVITFFIKIVNEYLIVVKEYFGFKEFMNAEVYNLKI